jgi:hypothetical protein
MTRTTVVTLGLAASGLLCAPRAMAQDTDAPPATPPSEAPTAAAPNETPPAAPPSEELNAPPSEVPPPEQKKDGGMGLEWLWLNADLGYSFADLGSLKGGSSLGIATTSSSGPALGIGAGVRLLFLTAGIRARDIPLSVGNVVEFDGEIGLHSPGSFQFYFGARGGYLFSGNLSANAVAGATEAGGSPPNVSFHGGNVGAMLGFDYYFNHFISLGLDANPEFMFIQRPPVPLPSFPSLPAGVTCPTPIPMLQQTCNQYTTALNSYNQIKSNPLYKESGSSIGVGFIGTLHFGVHF